MDNIYPYENNADTCLSLCSFLLPLKAMRFLSLGFGCIVWALAFHNVLKKRKPKLKHTKL